MSMWSLWNAREGYGGGQRRRKKRHLGGRRCECQRYSSVGETLRVAMLLRLLARPQLRIPRLTSARRLSTAIDPELYHNVCERTLEALQDVYEEYADADPALLMDVEYADGVLNVIVGTQGTFVLNKQAPNLQLWLSSPISGPLRYDFSVQDAAWLNVRDGHSLLKLLADDFEKLTKKPLRLEAVAVAVRVAAVE